MFWSVPPFGNYWWRATTKMENSKAFYDLLGVKKVPGIENYAALILEITSKDVIEDTDIQIHSECLAELGKKLGTGDDDVSGIIRTLCDEPSLLNNNRELFCHQTPFGLTQIN